MFGWFICCGAIDDTETPHNTALALKPKWKASNVSLRGHLVRTYNHAIEVDFYIDREHELGKGGCGVVVVGEHKDTRQQYAIKIVNKSTAERGRLDRELKLMKDVDHANIVRLFSVYDVPGNMFFVMELCLGGHLGSLLSRQPQKFIDESWAKSLCRQMLSAVAHIHARGIAHRDIKLQNILVDSTNDRTAQLKLIDFGYGSRFVGALPMRTKCGTPYTTAPEVIRESYDERCDLWSCGVVLYIMLCGRRPFEALDIGGPLSDAGKAAMIANILAGRFHFNHKPFQNVSKAGVNFVKTLLHQDYKTRIRAYEAMESPWFNDTQIIKTQTNTLTSAKSFRAINNMRRSSVVTDMQRAGMVAVVFGINARSAVDLRSVFQSFDRDGSGTISKEEFHEALKLIMPELTTEDVDRLFDIVDIDHNQTISYTEFLAATLDPREVDLDELNKAFKLLDEDGNGFITKDELRKVVRMMIEQARTHDTNHAYDSAQALRDEYLSHVMDDDVEGKVNEIFAQVDVNGDGRISLEEFFWAMTGGQMETPTESTLPSSKSPSARITHQSSRNQLEEIGTGTTRRNSYSNSQTSPSRKRNSYSSPVGMPFMANHIDEEEDDGAGTGGGVGGGGGGGMSFSHRHTIAAMRMSSVPRILETSEHGTSSGGPPGALDVLSTSGSVKGARPFSGLVARNASIRSAYLPPSDDFNQESSSPRPKGDGNIVFYDAQSDVIARTASDSEKGEGEVLVDAQADGDEGDGDELVQQEPSSSSCNSYDDAKVRALFGPPVPFYNQPAVGSKKIVLPPIRRPSRADDVMAMDSSLGVEYDEQSESQSRHLHVLSTSGRSTSMGRLAVDSSSGPPIRVSSDTNFRESARLKKAPTLRDVNGRSDLSVQSMQDDRRDAPMRGGSMSSSMIKNYISGDLSGGNQSQPLGMEDHSFRGAPGLLASFSRIMHSGKLS